jgi:hypothetical protein
MCWKIGGWFDVARHRHQRCHRQLVGLQKKIKEKRVIKNLDYDTMTSSSSTSSPPNGTSRRCGSFFTCFKLLLSLVVIDKESNLWAAKWRLFIRLGWRRKHPVTPVINVALPMLPMLTTRSCLPV